MGGKLLNINRSIFKAQIKIFVILVVFVTSPESWATIYYVDATNGSDANNGYSRSTAWKTITKINSLGFNHGDSILFKRGEVWREQLVIPSSGAPGNSIYFGAYGTGNNPIINGADLIAEWSMFITNVWRAKLTTAPNIVMIDEILGHKKSSLELLAEEYDWYYQLSEQYLYLYSLSNPETEYINPGVEASVRNVVDLNMKNYITLSNLTFKNSNKNTLTTGDYASDYIIVENCTITRSAGTAISGYIGSDYWIIRGNTITYCGGELDRDGIYFYDKNTSWEIYDNKIYNSGGDDIAIAGSGHRIYRNDLGPSTSLAIGISIDPGSKDIWIYENKIHGHDIEGIVVKGSNCKIFKNRIYENGYDGILINGEEADSSLEIYQNLIWGHHNGYSGISLWVGGNNVKIYNNVIFNNDIGIYQHHGQTGVVIANNIIMSNNLYGFIGGPETPTLIHNNCYNIGTNYLGVEDHTGTSGNISQNPLFIDESNYDFTLRTNSPCIDAGIDVGLPYYGIAPDLGAFEFIPNPIYPKPKKFPFLDPNIMTLKLIPNPANSSTIIHINKPIDVNSFVMQIVNIKGQIVMEREIVGASSQIEVYWNLKDKYQKHVSSGVYLVILRSHLQQVIEKLLVLQ